MISVRFASVSYSLARGKTVVQWWVPGAMACMDGKRHHRLVKEGKTHIPCTECFNPQDPHQIPKLPMSNRQSWSMDFFFGMYWSSLCQGFKNPYVFGSTPGGQHTSWSCWYQAYDHSQTAIPVKTFWPHPSASFLKSAGRKPKTLDTTFKMPWIFLSWIFFWKKIGNLLYSSTRRCLSPSYYNISPAQISLKSGDFPY